MLQVYCPNLVYYAICFLGYLALGKHLVKAYPFVYALQCLTGKVEKFQIKVMENGTKSFIN